MEKVKKPMQRNPSVLRKNWKRKVNKKCFDPGLYSFLKFYLAVRQKYKEGGVLLLILNWVGCHRKVCHFLLFDIFFSKIVSILNRKFFIMKVMIFNTRHLFIFCLIFFDFYFLKFFSTFPRNLFSKWPPNRFFYQYFVILECCIGEN